MFKRNAIATDKYFIESDACPGEIAEQYSKIMALLDLGKVDECLILLGQLEHDIQVKRTFKNQFNPRILH